MKRNVKRFVSMILAIMMVATFTVNAFAASFVDVGESRWSYKAVEYCAEKGYMAGVGKSTFDPNGKVTRAMVAQTLWNRKGKTPPTSLTHFNDVASDAWYASAVNWCKEQDVVSGVGKGKFDPNSSVTRGDFCLMLYNFANKYHADKVNSNKYTDEYAMAYLDEVSSKGYEDAASWHAKALAWAYETKLISGSGKDANGKAVLDSRGTCTREQLAQFLMNFDTQVLGDKVEEPVERKCEHGNDPDTCPICHPAEPTYEGSYNPNPPAEAFYADNDAGKQYASKTIDKYDYHETMFTDEMYNSALTNGYYMTANGKKMVLPEVEYVPGSVPGKSYQGYVPYKGYVIGGDTYTTTIGNHTYTKATGGSIFNRYGVDVTNVDGVMSSTEAQIARFLARRLKTTVGYDHTNGCNAYFDPALQMAAEYALEEAKENVDNLVHAGLPGSTHEGGWGVAAAEARVSQTRNILEKSKTIDANADYDDGREDLAGYISALGNGAYYDDDELYKDVTDAMGNGVADPRVGYKSLNTHNHLSVAPLFEYFGGEIFYKTYDTNTNAVAAQGPLFCVGSGSLRLSPGTKYTTFLNLCQESYSNISDWLDLGSSHGDKLYGVAFDEETNQIYILVAAMANDTPNGINRRTNGNEADINAFYTQG